MRLYNTLPGKKELFVPMTEGQVLMYICGPTVHDYAHIGNFRTFVFQDLLRRWLVYKGYRVKQVMNITDVDEKTIERALRKKVKLPQMTGKYTKAFFADLRTLNIERVEVYPRAAAHIEDMAKVAETLLRNGHAFRANDGTVYFDVNRFEGYGRLSKNRPPKKVVAKTKREDYAEPKHFALWKPWDGKDGGIYWDTILGRGRPGWHVECSTMAMKCLGDSMDIHSGGSDLIFPHHENGIAISESVTGKPFARYWLHAAPLLIDGKKMSKTLRNSHTLREILEKGYSPSALRLLLLSTHYRKRLNFTFNRLKRAEKRISALRGFLDSLKNADVSSSRSIADDLRKMKADFESAMDDDLDTEAAFDAVFRFVGTAEKKKVNKRDAKNIEKTVFGLDRVLGILG